MELLHRQAFFMKHLPQFFAEQQQAKKVRQ